MNRCNKLVQLILWDDSPPRHHRSLRRTGTCPLTRPKSLKLGGQDGQVKHDILGVHFTAGHTVHCYERRTKPPVCGVMTIKNTSVHSLYLSRRQGRHLVHLTRQYLRSSDASSPVTYSNTTASKSFSASLALKHNLVYH